MAAARAAAAAAGAHGDLGSVARFLRAELVAGKAEYGEAAVGKLYSAKLFSETFENHAGLGGADTIRDRISVLATKGHIKFVRDASHLGVGYTRSKFGYLCVEGMRFPVEGEAIDPDTGEVLPATAPVLPSHFKCPHTGASLPVENPEKWVYPAGEDAP